MPITSEQRAILEALNNEYKEAHRKFRQAANSEGADEFSKAYECGRTVALAEVIVRVRQQMRVVPWFDAFSLDEFLKEDHKARHGYTRTGFKHFGDPDTSESGIAWWVYPKGWSGRQIRESLRRQGVESSGYSCHPTISPCGHRYAAPIWIRRQGNRILVTQSYGRDT